MSSDSEDDCYGNIAQKLQSLKNKYEELNCSQPEVLAVNCSGPEPSKNVDKVNEIADNSLKMTAERNACEITKDDSDCEEISLDTIIAQNTKKKAKRISASAISVDNILPTRGRKRSRISKSDASATVDLEPQNMSDIVESSNDFVSNTSVNKTRKKGRGRQRGRRGSSTSTNTCTNTTNPTSTPTVSTIPNLNILRGTPRSSSRNRGSNPRRHGQVTLPDFLSAMWGFSSHYPTYSVGNTDEYPDQSDNQPLFTNQADTNEVVFVRDNEQVLNDSLDENEELSVKVYWQSRECIKFTIRRFQKLQPVFDFFAKRENVSQDKLFFTYNDKILKNDDTPDSITYSIVKFIDGGIINQSVSNISHKDHTVKDGIKLKFQYQHAKKPYEIYIRTQDKLIVAMTRCAEHLEKPLEKLKFLFDGDLISGKNTPQELDLEGGECIDVKIS